MRHLSFGKGLNYFWTRATHQAMEIKADFRLGELEFQVSRYQWEKGKKLDRIYYFEELLFLWAQGEKKLVIPWEEAPIYKI